ncbi:nitroreductase family protein [Candidatus Woesearchaeota archaeon]|nr:nitroreductase family protein [Candidatus Woesearchaeota archaeon]
MSNNYFLKLVKSRKTTYEFNDKKVGDNKIKKILDAARWSPSCSNTQPWHFIIIKDKKRIKQLMMTANYGDFHTDPPLMIAFMLEQGKCPGDKHSCYRGADSGTYDSYMSVGMAALNATLEARELGIDSCIITPKQVDAKKILKVKNVDAVPIIVGFGFQKKEAFQKIRERTNLSEITSYESFGGKNE